MKWIHFVFLVLASLISTDIAANINDQLEFNSIIDVIVQVLDKNGDGKITSKDLEEVVGSFGDVPAEAIIGKLDKNNDKAVDHTDLEIEVKKLSNAIVDMYDFDDNGYLTKNEANYPNNVYLATTVKGLELCLTFLFDLADLNGDGIISDSDFPKLAPFQKLTNFLNKTTNIIIHPLFLPVQKQIDINETYQISRNEVTELLSKMAEKVDINDDGTVTLQEILQSMVWFDLFDLNDDEFISDADYYPELAPFQILKNLILEFEDALRKNIILITYNSTLSEYEDKSNLIKIKPDNFMKLTLISLLLKAIDVNEDNEISRTESTQFLTETMDKLDQNDDGTVEVKEVFETMEEFKFLERYIQHGEQIHDICSKILNLLFDNFDMDANGMINGDELSNAFVKPMPSSYFEIMQESYVRPTYNYEEDMNEEHINATLASVSSFLRSPNSAASVNISFILTSYVFVCSALMN